MQELQQGQTLYTIENWRVVRYKYLCVLPGNVNYHILINLNEEPVRMYKNALEAIIRLNLKSWDEAHTFLISQLESYITKLKEEQNG
jgi:hypothetical protein